MTTIAISIMSKGIRLLLVLLRERKLWLLLGKTKTKTKNRMGNKNFLIWGKLADLLLKLLKVTSELQFNLRQIYRVLTSRDRIR